MQKDERTEVDELRPEYDFERLEVRGLGPQRKSFGSGVIRLDPDVAAMFPSAESANEALRFLIRITKSNEPPLQAGKAIV